jgi:hypothetical protein
MTEYDPQLMALSGLGQKERIQILLSEYGALRSEINSRSGYGFQMTAIAAAAITWFAQQAISAASWERSLVLIAAIAVIAAALNLGWRVNGRDIWRAADRVRELENEINSRAGEQLLVWETLWGPARVSLNRSLFADLTPSPRSSLRPLNPVYIEREQEDRIVG